MVINVSSLQEMAEVVLLIMAILKVVLLNFGKIVLVLSMVKNFFCCSFFFFEEILKWSKTEVMLAITSNKLAL